MSAVELECKQQELENDDEWLSDENNEGWHSKECNCWECSIDYRDGCCDYDPDNLTDKNNTFLEIENNYFMGWADYKILPHKALIKFFKCIELCDNYNLKYSSNPNIKDTNHELKLLKYHYNSLKYSVQTQYLLNKYNCHNSYSLLIYGYIRNIINNQFTENDNILIPFCLVNLCVIFYDELITHYTKLLQLTHFIQNNFYKTNEIQYITLNYSKTNDIILTDTINFIFDYIEGYEQKSNYYLHKRNKKTNELSQILWNTITFLQMKNNVLWFKYGVILCNLYIQMKEYKNSKVIMKYIDNHQFLQKLQTIRINQFVQNQSIELSIITQYYSCKIQHVLIDICTNNNITKYKLQLMNIYNESKLICDNNINSFEFYEIYFNYFKLFLLLNDYENASKYLKDACYLYYNEEMYRIYDSYIDQTLLEYNLLLYMLLNGINNFDIELFCRFNKSRDRTIFRSQNYNIYSTNNYILLNIYDLCNQFNKYKIFVDNVFIINQKYDISKILLLNINRTFIDQFLFEKCVNIISDKKQINNCYV